MCAPEQVKERKKYRDNKERQKVDNITMRLKSEKLGNNVRDFSILKMDNGSVEFRMTAIAIVKNWEECGTGKSSGMSMGCVGQRLYRDVMFLEVCTIIGDVRALDDFTRASFWRS